MPGHYGNRNGRTTTRRRSNGRSPRVINSSVMTSNNIAGMNRYRGNLTANEGQYVNQRTGEPYSGPMHMHNGRAMVGAEHSSQPHDYLVQVNNNGRNSHGAGSWFYEDTGQPYSGHMVDVGGVMYSTPDGVYSGHSRPLVQRSNSHGGNSNGNMTTQTRMRRSPSRRRTATRRTSTSRAARTPMRNRSRNMRSGNMSGMGRRRGSSVSNRRRNASSVTTVRRSPSTMRRSGGY